MALALSLATLLSVACSFAPEQPILAQFFNASRLRDRTALDLFALVVFEPQVQGIVTSFTIASVTPERRSPLTVANAEHGTVVERSLGDPRNPVDAALATKEVTVEAQVRMPDGRSAQRTLIVTMQRAVLRGEKEMAGRWIITGFKG